MRLSPNRRKEGGLCYEHSCSYTEDMAAWIESEAYRLGVSVADVIREGVQRMMNDRATIEGKK